MVPCKSTAEEVSFEWSHHRISSTDSKVRTTLHVSIIDSAGERAEVEPKERIGYVNSPHRLLRSRSTTIVSVTILSLSVYEW